MINVAGMAEMIGIRNDECHELEPITGHQLNIHNNNNNNNDNNSNIEHTYML